MLRVDRDCVGRIHRAYAVGMALTEIGDIRPDRFEPTLAADGPGPPTLRGLGTSKHTALAEDLTRPWAVGPANYYHYFHHYYYY